MTAPVDTAKLAERLRAGQEFAMDGETEALLREAADALEAAALTRAAMFGALGESCAECGHIDWRADPNEYLDRMEAAEAESGRAWSVLDWLAANNPGALELCPYKATRSALSSPDGDAT